MHDDSLERPLAVAQEGTDPFDDVLGRSTADYVLRNVHQQLVAVSNQADLKANIMITVSSILVSIAATRLDDGELRPGLITLMSFLLLALVFAVVSVLPKFPIPGAGRSGRQKTVDLLFFGHFAELDARRYQEEMAAVLRDDGAIYKALVANLHNQGSYLLNAKYRFLFWSYFWFLGGIVVAGIVLLATVLSG
jgi:hypothetical protein